MKHTIKKATDIISRKTLNTTIAFLILGTIGLIVSVSGETFFFRVAQAISIIIIAGSLFALLLLKIVYLASRLEVRKGKKRKNYPAQDGK